MNTILITKTINYKGILSEIARERGLDQLAKHIESFIYMEENEQLTEALGTPVYNLTKKPENQVTGSYRITTMPEATCDGCQ